MDTLYDVVIVGAGPAGLSAALALGRARKRTLVCDAGPRRNAAASHLHNFVTRDGTPPQEFRDVAVAQLAAYPHVETRATAVTAITGARGAFAVELATGAVTARRVLLCVGMIDELPPIDGFHALWGTSIFQCPYCHGWEARDRRWGYLATRADHLAMPLLLRGWTREVVVFVGAELEVPGDLAAGFAGAGITVERRPVARLIAADGRLAQVELADGARVPCDALFAHPPQRPVELVRALGLDVDDHGLVLVDPHTRATSVPGIYAAGDALTRMQGAVIAAASGGHAAATLNHELTVELAGRGELSLA
ncbi:MAG: NAD(P)/FAD-dependent oxidoreductase [Kofleriaceae bacterium]